MAEVLLVASATNSPFTCTGCEGLTAFFDRSAWVALKYILGGPVDIDLLLKESTKRRRAPW